MTHKSTVRMLFFLKHVNNIINPPPMCECQGQKLLVEFRLDAQGPRSHPQEQVHAVGAHLFLVGQF